MRTTFQKVLLWGCVLLAPLSLRADYVQSFSEAVRAIDRSQWNEAAAALESALRDNPDEGGYVIVYGTRRELYVPYFLLGKVQMSLGSCEKALDAFRKSESQGVIQSDPSKFRELKSLKSECPEPEPKTTGTPPPPEPLVNAAQTPPTTVEPKGELTQQTPSPVEKPGVEPNVANAPTTKPERARDPDPTEVEHLVELRVAKGALESRLDQARSLLRNDEGWVADDALVEEGRKIASLVRRGENALKDDNLDVINSVTRDLLASKSRIESLLRLGLSPSQELVAIFSAYASGDYSRVVTLADRFRSTRPRSRSQAALFKAAALYGSHVRSDQRDSEQLADARKIVSEIRTLDPNLKPSSRLFPEGFVSLFQEPR